MNKKLVIDEEKYKIIQRDYIFTLNGNYEYEIERLISLVIKLNMAIETIDYALFDSLNYNGGN